MKTYRQLTRNDRLVIETMLNLKKSVREIALYLGVHRSTVYREINRGKYEHRNYDYTYSIRYSSNLGQQAHDWNKQSKGNVLKIGHDLKLAEFLERKIVDEKYSPEAAIAEAKKGGFSRMISVRTLYRYIDAGLFLQLTNKDLPVKGSRKKHLKKVRPAKRAAAGTSIERRPDEISFRNTFGHWEMDTVKGSRGKTKGCLLVLTERLTRNEIIVKLSDQRSESVIRSLDILEHKWGDLFRKVFQTITVDNGSEFSDCAGIEQSVFGGSRTKCYYCHPYSSWERGSNENNNKLIRRHIPKGMHFDHKSDQEISDIESWMNHYPRRIFRYRSSADLFQEQLALLE